MIRVYFVIALIIFAFFALRKFQKAPPEVISKLIKKTGLVLFVVIIVLLTATGKLNGLFALVGVLIAFVFRMLPSILRYVPQLHGLWHAIKPKNKQTTGNGFHQSTGKMSKKEACEVLGLTLLATEKEIINAHRLLIQKMHPDRGGSDYLAAKINLAKKVLLEK